MKLYRAANYDYVQAGECLARRVSDARAYLDNPGFGGRTLYRAVVEIDEARVLRVGRDLSEMADALGASASDWADAGYERPYHVILSVRGTLEALAEAGYDWMVYEDDFPQGCETWMLLGDDVDDMEEIE